MKEYSCRQLDASLDLFEQAGFDLTEAFASVPFDRVFVTRRNERIDWDDAMRVLEAVEQIVGGRDAMLALVRDRYGATARYGFLKGLASLIFNPRDLYRGKQTAYIQANASNLKVEWRDLPDGRIENTFMLPETHRSGQVFFAATHAAMEAMPCMMGYPPATVDAEISAHRATYCIDCPPSVTMARRLKLAYQALFRRRQIWDFIDGQSKALVDRYRDVERLNRELTEILEHAAYGVVLLDGTTIRFANQAFSHITGHAQADLVGHDITSLIAQPPPDELTAWLNDGTSGRTELAGMQFERDGRSLARARAERRRDTMFNGRPLTMLTLRETTREDALERQVMESGRIHREAIARELHDDLGQQLTAVALLVGRHSHGKEHTGDGFPVRELETFIEGARRTTRAVARGLKPVPDGPCGLHRALRRLVEDFQRTGSTIAFDLELEEVPSPAPLSANELYGIAQEALTNAIKHAHPNRIGLRLARTGSNRGAMEISDDGVGFALGEEPPANDGLGLENMRRRARLADIRLALDSAPGDGTRIVCEFAIST